LRLINEAILTEFRSVAKISGEQYKKGRFFRGGVLLLRLIRRIFPTTSNGFPTNFCRGFPQVSSSFPTIPPGILTVYSSYGFSPNVEGNPH